MSSGRRRKPAGGPRKQLETLPTIDGLEFGKKLGQGHFSEVYEGIYKGKYPAAIKVIERGSSHLIELEIELLKKLKGQPHIIQLYEVINDETTILVFELVKSLSIDDFFDGLTSKNLKYIIRWLIEATHAAHKKGILHRDIKLGNIMITDDYHDLKLIDWGCGCYISDSMSSKAGSRTCRSPEMLLGYRNYGTGGDVWAIGCFIFYILTDSVIPWKARTSEDVIVALSKIYGSKPFLNLAEKYDLVIDELLIKKMSRKPRKTLEAYFDENCSDLVDPNLVDLMKKLLTIDPEERITLPEALEHPYFH